jgi:carboxylate-amine ligase
VKQVIPADITGLVGAPAASVVDHKFGSSDPFTLGVEEEYMLLDPESLDLVQHIETVLDAVEGDELADRINAELMQSVLEIATPVCQTAGDVMRELQTLRGYVTEVAGKEGPALIHSVCSSASGSRRRTATTR